MDYEEFNDVAFWMEWDSYMESEYPGYIESVSRVA